MTTTTSFDLSLSQERCGGHSGAGTVDIPLDARRLRGSAGAMGAEAFDRATSTGKAWLFPEKSVTHVIKQ
jgi:hypothetical protein